jgi:aminoglycoside phosphotransferase (APT) family kinase protein
MEILSHTQSIDHPNEIIALLSSVLGSQARLTECRIINQDLDYWVLYARLHHPEIEVVVKLAGPEARMACHFDRTASIHKLVSDTTAIPLPETIAFDVGLEKWPWRYLIRTYTYGTEWAYLRDRLGTSDLVEAYRQLGEAVGQLHGISFPAFGEIGSSGLVTDADPSCHSALIRHATRIIRSPRLLSAFIAALEQRAVLFDGLVESRMCHEDLHGYNILFHMEAGKWRLATILDFDKAWAGHLETDLARLELWTGMTSPDFWASYRHLRSLDVGYLQRRPIYQLLWCLEYARSTPEHLADTRRVCQELGIPVIDAFD